MAIDAPAPPTPSAHDVSHAPADLATRADGPRPGGRAVAVLVGAAVAVSLLWNLGGPQTGVRYIGPSKLEMISNYMDEASHRLGVSPETARDLETVE